MTDKSVKNDYYYAGGKKIPLVPATGMFAIHDAEIEERIPEGDHVDRLKTAARPLRRGVAIVNDCDIPDSLSQEVRSQNAAHPVFESDGVLIVPLPEVRIEDTSSAKMSEVGIWLQDNVDLAEVVSEREGRVVVKPVSNDPAQALEIANRVNEEVGPAMAQTRFLRYMRREK